MCVCKLNCSTRVTRLVTIIIIISPPLQVNVECVSSFFCYRFISITMDNPNHQVKECTTAAYDYLLNKSDKNSVVLQKQLQSVSLINDLEIFDSSSSETLELYLSLEKFLTPTEARSTIAGKVLALFAHISESCTIRAALR